MNTIPESYWHWAGQLSPRGSMCAVSAVIGIILFAVAAVLMKYLQYRRRAAAATMPAKVGRLGVGAAVVYGRLTTEDGTACGVEDLLVSKVFCVVRETGESIRGEPNGRLDRINLDRDKEKFYVAGELIEMADPKRVGYREYLSTLTLVPPSGSHVTISNDSPGQAQRGRARFYLQCAVALVFFGAVVGYLSLYRFLDLRFQGEKHVAKVVEFRLDKGPKTSFAHVDFEWTDRDQVTHSFSQEMCDCILPFLKKGITTVPIVVARNGNNPQLGAEATLNLADVIAPFMMCGLPLALVLIIFARRVGAMKAAAPPTST